MPFSPRIVEARLALKLVRPEEFPALAIDSLEAGLDGPVICRLAGLIQPTDTKPICTSSVSWQKPGLFVTRPKQRPLGWLS